MLPVLRFQEFSDEWKVLNFYDVLDEVLDFRGRTPLKLGMQWGGDIPSLSALNVKMGYIDFSLDPHAGSEELYQKWMAKSNLEKNDILFTMEAPLGNVAFVPDDKKYILSQRVIALKIKQNTSSGFIYQLMRSDSFQNRIKKLSTGSTAKGINQKTLQKVKISKPTHEEQEKIADFLEIIDKKILALRNRTELLGQYQKGASQAVFSQKIRFKSKSSENYHDWKKRSLGELGKFYRGLSYNSSNVKDTGNLVLRSSNIQGGKLILDRDLQFVNKSFDDKIALKRGDIVICMANGSKALVGKAGIFGGGYSGNITAGAFCSIYRSKSLIAKFLFKTGEYSIFLQRILAGTNINNLKNTDLAELSFTVPTSIEEEQKITGFLAVIDSEISLTRKKLKQVGAYKKALLSRMFV